MFSPNYSTSNRNNMDPARIYLGFNVRLIQTTSLVRCELLEWRIVLQVFNALNKMGLFPLDTCLIQAIIFSILFYTVCNTVPIPPLQASGVSSAFPSNNSSPPQTHPLPTEPPEPNPPCRLVQRGVTFVVSRIDMRALHEEREGDVVVPVPTRQVQRCVFDSCLRVQVSPLADELPQRGADRTNENRVQAAPPSGFDKLESPQNELHNAAHRPTRRRNITAQVLY